MANVTTSSTYRPNWFVRNQFGKRLAVVSATFFFLFFLLFPFTWMLVTSIRGGNLFDIADTPFRIDAVTFEHYSKLLAETRFLTWMWNSFFVAIVS